MQRGVQVQFSVLEQKTTIKKKIEEKTRSKEDEEHETKLGVLQDACYSDIMDVATKIATERQIGITNIVPMETYRYMAERLPESETDLLQIPHMTKANIEKFGARFLEVLVPYAAQKMIYEMERENELKDSNDEEESTNNVASDGGGVDWDSLGNQSSSNGKRGFKRKPNWSTQSRFKKYRATKGKKKSPAKRTTQKGNFGVKKNNLLPAPAPKF